MTESGTRAAYDAVAGLREVARLVREPTEHERFPAGILLLRKPAA
ncbi:hypothetical protein ACN3XK_16905 [Actinomadura welshii]